MEAKYKILVLSDLKESTDSALKSAIGMAKAIGAEIKFFHVKKATDIVERDSQLSTFRSINEQHTKTKNNIEALIQSISKSYGVVIDYSYVFGSVKNEINDYLDKQKPDIVVLGKRKPKPMGVPVDSITSFVLKIFKGTIMVAGNQNPLEPGKSWSIGVLNHNTKTKTDTLTDSFLKYSKKPLTAFRFIDQADKPESTENDVDNSTVEYVFEKNDNTIRNLSKYLLKSNINVLCLKRKTKKKNSGGLNNSDIKDFIWKIDVSMLISGDSNSFSKSI